MLVCVCTAFTHDQVAKMQEDMTRLILRLLHENPDIHYYQGLHDIVVTFLLEVGARTAYAMMTVLVHHHIRYVRLSFCPSAAAK